MENYRNRRVYFKTKEKKPVKSKISGVLLITTGIMVLYCLLMPRNSGFIGLQIFKRLRYLFGVANYIIPFLLVWAGIKIFKEHKIEKPVIFYSIQLAILWMGSSFMSLVTPDTPLRNLGGFVGKYSEIFLIKAMGEVGAFLFLLIMLFVILKFALSYSPFYIIKMLRSQMSREWKEWKQAKKETSAKTADAPIINLPKLNGAKNGVPDETGNFMENLKNLRKKVKDKIIVVKKEVVEKAADKQDAEKIKARPGSVYVNKSDMPMFRLPDVSLLNFSKEKAEIKMEEELVENAALLERTLASFNIQAKVTDINPGPVITRYDIQPGVGVKVGSIMNLSNDIALSMKAKSIRVVAPVPGKAAVGIEIPNKKGELVTLAEMLSDKSFKDSCSLLTLCLGKTTEGNVYTTDLMPMPHLLIAGATGSGKSVCIHSLILSILYKALPTQVKLLLIDPKRLELPVYNGLPHLYDPKCEADEVEVVTNPREASKSLEKLVKVMEMRYEKFAQATVRNIEGYNAYAQKNNLPEEFYIVVIIDELADLMMVAPKEIEDSIQRLAQMARAVGIHLVLATQRPSVDVITGVIKANLPSRIAFQVLSKVDSRVILDTTGADDLLGRGDMLFLESGEPKPIRLQGAYVSETEIENVVNFYKVQGSPFYTPDDVLTSEEVSRFEDEKSEKDIVEALMLVKERRRISHDLLKANFGSSARASNILSLLEVKGFINKPEGSNKWEIFFDKVDDYIEASGKEQEDQNMVLKEQE